MRAPQFVVRVSTVLRLVVEVFPTKGIVFWRAEDVLTGIIRLVSRGHATLHLAVLVSRLVCQTRNLIKLRAVLYYRSCPTIHDCPVGWAHDDHLRNTLAPSAFHVPMM